MSDKIHSFAGKGLFPAKYAFTLLIPLRNIFLSPAKLIRQLELKPHHNVLEIGPGPGYFSAKIASRLPEGKLHLLDVQQDMLAIAKKRLSKKKINNVEFHLGDGRKFPFPDEMFDIIFMVTVLGEVANHEDYAEEFHRVLKNDGILSIAEQAGDPDKMSMEQIDELLSRKNFQMHRKYGNRFHFNVIYKKHDKHTIILK